MSIKVTPLILTIRGYSDEIDTSVPLKELKTVPYDFICTIQIIEDYAFVSGFMGNLTLSNRKEIEKVLKNEYGITKAEWRRKSDNLISVQKS